MSGYIKDYRKELDSDIWMMPPLYHRVWQYLKYKVNHKENRIPLDDSFLTIKAGQHLTSVRNIAKETGWYERASWKEANPKTISKILEWLEKQEMISIDRGKGNRQYTLITLINWDSYQVKEGEGNTQGTAREQDVDINKNEKECIKNDFTTTAATTHVSENNLPEEKSDGVPLTDLKGESEDVPAVADEISHISQEQMILDHFVKLRNRGFMVAEKDRQAAKDILSANIPLQDAFRWMEEKFNNYQPRHNRDYIQSLEYCVGYIF
ncbi:hypothetical protein [Thalassobacillus sp. C254]|uniref:hypothetical protein n=1 Tax=Thalassobacillus sp. C254 TaxID=1225341 RepID=UPI0006D060A1|nr:hypothetical protein [Thalassobacillus sp. C254]